MKKFTFPIVLLVLLVGLQSAKYGSRWIAGDDILPRPEVTMAVAVYESLNQPAAEVSVLNGVTARAWRKAGKWRQYDKDKIPESVKPLLAPVIEKHKVPCLGLFAGEKVVTSAPLPKSDADLKTMLEGK